MKNKDNRSSVENNHEMFSSKELLQVHPCIFRKQQSLDSNKNMELFLKLHIANHKPG